MMKHEKSMTANVRRQRTRLKAALFLGICVSLTSSCTSTPSCSAIGAPARPVFVPITQEMWNALWSSA